MERVVHFVRACADFADAEIFWRLREVRGECRGVTGARIAGGNQRADCSGNRVRNVRGNSARDTDIHVVAGDVVYGADRGWRIDWAMDSGTHGR